MTDFAGVQAEVVDRVVLPPDPGLVESLGSNHTLDSALADLVDNSIDAKATVVRIRFLTQEHRLRTIVVMDNGIGMDAEQINAAMTIGRRREYPAGSLGNFGVGLKAAALGCAEVLTVWSHAAGAATVGRRLDRRSLANDFGCDVLATDAATAQARLVDELFGARTGSTVVLDEVRRAYHGSSDLEAKTWLESTIDLVRIHLGCVFHRWIDKHAVRIDLEIVESTDDEESMPISIRAIDPFGYRATGHPGYPRVLTAPLDSSRSVDLECHIWPAKTDVAGFRMGTKTGDHFQGFYVYRADRLLQIGSWDEAKTRQPERQLARVVIDDDSIVGTEITMTPEKRGIRFSPALLRAITKAVSPDGSTTFDSYISHAEDIYRQSRRRSHRRKPTIRPDKGFAPKLRRAIGAELDFVQGVEPIDVRWQRLPEGEFLDVDYATHTVWLNSRYRDVLVPGRAGLNDAPLVKALVYLLTHDIFDGEFMGSRDRDNIALWKAVLGAAVQEEASWWGH